MNSLNDWNHVNRSKHLVVSLVPMGCAVALAIASAATAVDAAVAPPAAAPKAAPASGAAAPATPATTTGPDVSNDALKTPAGVTEVVLLRPFILETPFEFDWRLERPAVRSGWLVVLAVDPALVKPRQVAEPVLFVGAQTAERLNIGEGSGRVVALVPAPIGDDGQVRPLLADAPAFFGTAMLPEQVDDATVKREVAAAKAAGIATAGADRLAAARNRGGEPLQTADRASLLRVAADLVRRFAPDEGDRARLLEGKPLD